MEQTRTLTAFLDDALLTSGPPAEVAVAVRRALDAAPDARALAFDDRTGAFVDFDLSGSEAEIAARHAPSAAPAPQPKPGPGRPRLGVVAREVTLLPRHWDWLRANRGGASAALRRLVEEAMRHPDPRAEAKTAMAAADRFMAAALGDQPGYEEASRALYARDGDRFAEIAAAWPADLRDHAARLAAPAFAQPSED